MIGDAGIATSRIAASKTVDSEVNDFIVDVENYRLDLFRKHLQVSVRHACPVALAVASHEGVDLAAILGRMRPPRTWPWRQKQTLRVEPKILVRHRIRHGMRDASQELRRRFEARFNRSGVLVRHPGDEGGMLGFRVEAGVVGVSAELGSAHIETYRRSACLHLPGEYPEVLQSAMLGKPVAVVAEHPVLSNLYLIRRVDQMAEGISLLFRAGAVPFEMPWPTLLNLPEGSGS